MSTTPSLDLPGSTQPDDEIEAVPTDPVDRLVTAEGQPRDKEPDQSTLDDAFAFFLEDERQTPWQTKQMTLNVGGSGSARRDITVRLRALTDVEQRKIMREIARRPNIRQIKDEESRTITRLAEQQTVMVAEAMVEPDLDALAQKQGITDKSVLIKRAFDRKPGLVAAMVATINSLGGFDDEDAVEMEAGDPPR